MFKQLVKEWTEKPIQNVVKNGGRGAYQARCFVPIADFGDYVLCFGCSSKCTKDSVYDGDNGYIQTSWLVFVHWKELGGKEIELKSFLKPLVIKYFRALSEEDIYVSCCEDGKIFPVNGEKSKEAYRLALKEVL